MWPFLDHLMGELNKDTHASASVRRTYLRPSSSTISNIFFSEIACPIKAKFYVEFPWVWRTKVCSRHLGHMTKMAAMPMYGQNPSQILISATGGPISTNFCM